VVETDAPGGAPVEVPRLQATGKPNSAAQAQRNNRRVTPR
jgi:hypothetical protein